MDIIKAIINLITSFFQHKTEKTKEESKIADAVKTTIVEEIRANQNAQAVQQNVEIQEALDNLHQKHEEEREDAKTNPNADDQQFGSDW